MKYEAPTSKHQAPVKPQITKLKGEDRSRLVAQVFNVFNLLYRRLSSLLAERTQTQPGSFANLPPKDSRDSIAGRAAVRQQVENLRYGRLESLRYLSSLVTGASLVLGYLVLGAFRPLTSDL